MAKLSRGFCCAQSSSCAFCVSRVLNSVDGRATECVTCMTWKEPQQEMW